MAVGAQQWLDAQYGVLGSVLISPELVPKMIAETSETDFQGQCQTVYLAIKRLFLAGAPVDLISVFDALGRVPEYQGFLMQLMEVTPTAANIDHYIALCRDQSRVAALQRIGAQLMSADSLTEIRSLLDKANERVVDKPSIRAVSMSAALRDFMERHSGKANYLSWPIRDLDEELFVEPGDFIIIGGRPSTGKSAFGLQCGWHWAQKLRVGFFSLETSSKKLFDRKMSGLAEIPMRAIKRNAISEEEWRRVALMNQEIIDTNLDIIPASGMSVADIRAHTLIGGYDLIIVDYLQLILSEGSCRYEKVTNISVALHIMAQSLGVTVVALCQLSRLGQKDRPTMDDLRESGQIEQDADVIMLLSLERPENSDGPRVLDVAKNKEGECPCIALDFDGKHQTFSKAKRTSEVVQKYTAEGKKAQRRRRNGMEGEQLNMLPDDTWTPFDEKGNKK